MKILATALIIIVPFQITKADTSCLELKDLIPKTEVSFSIPFEGGKLSYIVEPEKLGSWNTRSLTVRGSQRIPGGTSSFEFVDLGPSKQKWISENINGKSDVVLKTKPDGSLKGSSWKGDFLSEDITIVDNCLKFEINGKQHRGILLKTAYPATKISKPQVEYSLFVEGAGAGCIATGRGNLKEILKGVTDFKVK